MKKILLALTFLSIGTNVYALEISHPFAGAATGGWFSETNYAFSKTNYKDKYNQNHFLSEKLTYGLIPGLSVRALVGNRWKITNPDNGHSTRDDHNTTWSAGVSMSYNIEKLRTKTTVDYVQLDPNMKSILMTLRLGYELDIVYPHSLISVDVPIAASKHDKNDPCYDVYAGLYKLWTPKVATDTGFRFKFDDNNTGTDWTFRLRGDYIFMPALSLGTYGEYTFHGRAENDVKWDGYRLGLEIRAAF